MNNGELTILHVEDDPILVDIVKTAFTRFGFSGDMITAGSVNEALRVLSERTQDRKPVSLIISDMRLSDGTGLDLIREVKGDPAWRATPVIVLSHDVGQGIINDAYALGASSYLSKTDVAKNLPGSLQSIYNSWMENARLPRGGHRDRLQEALERAIGLRNRTAEFYLRLAGAFPKAPEESVFWLDRALNEGNLSNLLAFFLNRISEKDVTPAAIDRLTRMQAGVKDALKAAEDRLSLTPAPSSESAYRLALELTDSLDEEVFAEVLGILCPASDIATTALKVRAAAQMKDMASYIRDRAADTMLRRKAESLLAWSQRLGSDPKRTKEHYTDQRVQ